MTTPTTPNPHRVDQLARPPPLKPSPWKAWAVRFGVTLAGMALGASCPAWPLPVRPVCMILAQAVQGASSTLPPPPEPPAHDED